MSLPAIFIRKSTGDILLPNGVYPNVDMSPVQGLEGTDYQWLLKHTPLESPVFDSRIWVEVAPTEQSLVADLKKAGVSVTTTKAAIDADENSSLTGTAPVLTGDLDFLKGSLLTPVLVQTGAIETGQNLIMYLEVTKI